MSRALGLIETRGLVAAIEAADAMVKTANVTITGKEIIRPAMVTIKITGDVAAVKSALDAGASAASKVGEVISVHIIPSPDDQLLAILPEINNNGSDNQEKKPLLEKKAEDKNEVKDSSSDYSGTSSDNITTTLPESEIVIKPEIPDKVDLPEPEEIKPEHIKPKKERLPRKEKNSKEERNNKEEKKMTSSSESTSFSLGSLFDVNNETITRLRQEALGITESQDININIPPKADLPDNLDTLNVHQLRHLARSIRDFPIKGREISKANRQVLLNLFKGM